MPHQDIRARVLAGGSKDQGSRVVTYVDTSGRSWNARVLAAGSSSGLKIQIMSGRRIIDNVAKATTVKTTNAYRVR